MTDEELEHRLTAVENRAQSNTHRLDELGKLTDAVNGMNTNIKLTIQQKAGRPTDCLRKSPRGFRQ